MESINSRTMLFITGAFVGSNCWDEWKVYFENNGFKTSAPPWPYKDASVKELRSKHPNLTKLGTLKLGTLVDYYADIAKSLPEKPIVIGHSMGGLITQIIINRGLAAAGVAIHSFPPMGVIPYEFSFLWGGRNALGLFTSAKKTYLMTFKEWQYAFVNGMPLEEQKAAYEKYTIPESKTVVRGGLSSAAKIDFKKLHAPLLITSGSIDHSIPASLNYRNYKKYAENSSVLDYKEFKGRNHFVLGQPTWKEDADYILNWIERLQESTEEEMQKNKSFSSN